MLEPLGQSQVLAYVKRLAARHRICLMSFEKPSDWNDLARRNRLRRITADAGIAWYPLRYHKTPSSAATAFDIFSGTLMGAWITIRHQVGIVHARSYVSSVIALALRRAFRVKFVFDMRGFWPDEKVDAGVWSKAGSLYRVAKWFESKFLNAADCVVSLTQAAVDEMLKFKYLNNHTPRFEVITTCADLQLFSADESDAAAWKGGGEFTLGCVGSVGLSHHMFDETIECFKCVLRALPEAKMHILNREDHAFIADRMRKHGLPSSVFRLGTADHAGVARAMRLMDAGIFFKRPGYSTLATAPTKLGEFLGCGVPCLSNAGVGDMASILEGERVGVALRDFSADAMGEATGHLIRLAREPDIRMRCREAALKYFSLDAGVEKYAKIYSSLLSVPQTEARGA
jgi:glycosyltransferase involved in cell wall biosynthesis